MQPYYAAPRVQGKIRLLVKSAKQKFSATSPAPIKIAERKPIASLSQPHLAVPHELIFGNTRGNPDSEMDMAVKRVAERAGLNCGRCVTGHGNKCEEQPYCMNFFLDKFRRYAECDLCHGDAIQPNQ
jgi:hypothetical protein